MSFTSLKQGNKDGLDFFGPFPCPPAAPSFFCKRETIQKSLLNGLLGKYCHLQITKDFFFFINLKIIDLVVTKSYNSVVFFPAFSVSDVLFECSW